MSSNHLNKIWTGPEAGDPKPIIYLGGDPHIRYKKRQEEVLEALHFCCLSHFQLGGNSAHSTTLQLFRKHGIRAFLDSGAFSYQMRALKQNQLLDQKAAAAIIDQYADWVYLHAQEFTFDFLVTLDYLRDPKVVLWATKRLESRGLHPVPVFHIGSPLTALRRLMDTGYTLIGIGGLAGDTGGDHLPVSRHHAQAFLDQVFNMTEKYKVRCHGFGIGGQSIIRYPWFSVDSTSWAHYARRGLVNQPSHNPQKLFEIVKASPRLSNLPTGPDDMSVWAVQNIKFWSTLTDRSRPPVKRGLF